MMNQNIDELILRYLSSEISKEEREQLDSWLAEEESNIRYFFRLKNLYEISNPAFPPIAINENRALRKVMPSLSKRKVILRLSQIAAAVIICIGVATIVYRFVQTDQETSDSLQQNSPVILTLASGRKIQLNETDSQAISANDLINTYVEDNTTTHMAEDSSKGEMTYHQLIVPRGKEFSLTLSDNTKIRINADTKVCFPVEFIGDERRIFIEGEAYLEVARDTTSPFVVEMPHNEVVVLGTDFNVKTYREEESDQVTLVTGKVKVTSTATGQILTLLPGEQAILNKADGEMVKRSVDIDLYCSWYKGEMIFKNNSLEEILNMLSRRYDMTISWGDENLKEMSFSGEIKKYDNVERLLDMISHTNDVEFTVNNHNIVVNKP